MPVERAMTAYTQERLNCAQSVLRGFQQRHNLSEDLIEEARWHGGGRAKEGMCGALYAALSLVGDPPVRERVRDAFAKSVGSEKCRDIKRDMRVPCHECVRLAAKLLAEQTPGTSALQPNKEAQT